MINENLFKAVETAVAAKVENVLADSIEYYHTYKYPTRDDIENGKWIDI